MRNADGVETGLYDGTVRTPSTRVDEALAWIAADYPAKWLRLVRLCERAKASGWPRIRRGDLFVLAGQQGLDVSLCMEFRMDNNLWSVLSRYLLMFRPELASVVFPREADIDRAGIDLEDAWHRTVAWSTVFPCRTWQQAAERYREAA